MKETTIHLSRGVEAIKGMNAMAMDGMKTEDLALLGVSGVFDENIAKAMDAMPGMVTTPNIGNYVQFFQWWMPEAIDIILQKRNADTLLGRDVVGTWEDDEVVFAISEKTGQVRPYSDVSDPPLVSYNIVPEKRQNVRFEMATRSTRLEDLRASRMRINPDKERRAALALAFAINQNAIAFSGYNPRSTTNTSGSLTYGLFNDPNLLAYLTSTDTSNDDPFASSTFDQQVARINLWMTTLVTQTKQNANPFMDKMKVGIAPTAYNAMATTMNALGTKSVLQWFTETYKGAEIFPVMEFEGANGGDNVAYIILQSLGGKKCAMQAVTAEMRLLGIEPRAKGVTEVYTSGTAGTIVTQPLGIVRVSGI